MTIAKGESETFEISGGANPYTAESDKSSVTATVSGDIVTVAVEQGSTANTATITVTDDNEDTVDVDITITSE